MGVAKLLPTKSSVRPHLSVSPSVANRLGKEKKTAVTVGQNTSLSIASLAATRDSSANNLACATCPMRSLGICDDAISPLRGSEPSGPTPLTLTNSAHGIPARKVILHPKEWSDSAAVICEGIALSMISTTNGRRQILSVLLPGDVVSALDLFAPRIGYTTEAVTDVTYRRFSRQKIREYAFKYRTVMETLIKAISNENARINKLLLDLGCRTSEERIAGFILNLHSRMKAIGRVNDREFSFPFRLHHIADALGLSAVYASKALGKLERAGLIEVKQRELKMLNVESLRELAGAASINEFKM